MSRKKHSQIQLGILTFLLLGLIFNGLSVATAQETVGLTEPQVTNYLNFFVLFALMVICILLSWKPNAPILNFIMGMLSFGIAASTAGQTNLLFYGYIQFSVIIIAVLCMYSGYKNWDR